jgi:hypothetical protein
MERTIAYYLKGTEDFVSEYLVELEVAEISKIWETEEGDPEYLNIYPVEEAQKAAVEKLLGEKLELNKYDYYLETHQEG